MSRRFYRLRPFLKLRTAVYSGLGLAARRAFVTDVPISPAGRGNGEFTGEIGAGTPAYWREETVETPHGRPTYVQLLPRYRPGA
jgi:hypothetical protein